MGHSHSHAHGGHGHSHGGGADSKLLTVDVASGVNASLTAHLSKAEGNELDVFFVTAAGAPQPTHVSHFDGRDASGGSDATREGALWRGRTIRTPIPCTPSEDDVLQRHRRRRQRRDVRRRLEPAPADERPAGETSACSHYVAKAPQMRAETAALTVTAALTIRGAPVSVVWAGFDALKYAHHVE